MPSARTPSDLESTPTGAGYGPLGRLGRWAGAHLRFVLVAWAAVAIGLGLFAPRAETSLAGAGWEASGSESVAARNIVQREFGGLSSAALQVVVQVPTGTIQTGHGASAVQRAIAILKADRHISTIVPPTSGVSVSPDGRTGVIQAGAATGDTNEMVRVADGLKGPLTALSSNDVTVELTGSSALWGDFNDANRAAMLRSELMSWPVTLAILVLAFGSLVAAGLPLMLTVIGLTAAAGSLYLASRLADVSIWAMNFAFMFALALGIDYALFIVVRYRTALRRQPHDAGDAVAETMDTAGKAVMFSGLTVLISLSAVLLVPSPAFRSTALGIMLADVFVLAATLTLLPAVLVRLGARVSIAVLVVGLGSLAFRLVPLVAARRVPARLSTVAGWAGVAVLAAYTVRAVLQHHDPAVPAASLVAAIAVGAGLVVAVRRGSVLLAIGACAAVYLAVQGLMTLATALTAR